MIYSKLLGTGSYLPEKVLTNSDLEKIVDTNNKWIVERTGIKERRIAASHETAASMAKEAGLKALEAANLSKNDIDLLIVGSATPDRIFPSLACMIQPDVARVGCPAFDISAACAGFSYALGIADNAIKSGMANNVLIIGSETLSRITDWEDRSTCVLFGDGAGAFVLSASDEPGVYSTHLHADGTYQDILYAPNLPLLPKDVEAKESRYIKMKGNEVFKFAVTELGNIVDETLSANNMVRSAVDWLVPHQANLRIINAIAKKLNLPMERVLVTIDKHGNTSTASIPLAMDAGIRDGRIKRGDVCLLESFGGGIAWGSVLLKY